MARRTVGQGGSYATKDKLLCLRVADNNRVIVAAKKRSVSRIHSQKEVGVLRVERTGVPEQERDGEVWFGILTAQSRGYREKNRERVTWWVKRSKGV
jgi:hypothetical protein